VLNWQLDQLSTRLSNLSTMLTFEDALQEIKQSAQLRVCTQNDRSVCICQENTLQKTFRRYFCTTPATTVQWMVTRSLVANWQADKAFTISQRVPAGSQAQPLVSRDPCARIFYRRQYPSAQTLSSCKKMPNVLNVMCLLHTPPKKANNIRPKGTETC